MQKINEDAVGIESARIALTTLDPRHAGAYNRVLGEPGEKYADSNIPNYAVEGALKLLIRNQNDIIDALGSSSTAPFPR